MMDTDQGELVDNRDGEVWPRNLKTVDRREEGPLGELMRELLPDGRAWVKHALCGPETADIFFSGPGSRSGRRPAKRKLSEDQALALKMCSACPVRVECLLERLTFPLLDDAPPEIRAGLFGAELRTLRRALKEGIFPRRARELLAPWENEREVQEVIERAPDIGFRNSRSPRGRERRSERPELVMDEPLILWLMGATP